MSWQKYAIKILATSIGKKLIVFGIAKMYGVPRIYRRALELNNKIFKKPETRKFTANLLKQGFLLPNTISSKLTPVKTFPNSTSPIVNSSSTGNTVASPYTPSRLVSPPHPNLPAGSIKNPTTLTPTTQTTTAITSTSTSTSMSTSKSTSKSTSESTSSTSKNSPNTSSSTSSTNPKEPLQK
ncbi:hypothetical protein RclHR1_00910011 [Rhizophagus clarus]|uniref:Uncharacterized protein n=1 Tax=Rhizophagus clarus TaxID=94130 RepID=A0A2Z6S5H4_9GLOM|nr:hypothetical protein RclHR1_00910011 [Rhizophagus clarus]GES75366.1 hypothetical protein GLOIN_2v1495618 [Rhizophagus clarus]